MFNPVSYFQTLASSLKLTKNKYLFSKVSGMDELEGILSNRKYNQYHIAVDVDENGAVGQGKSRGYFDRRPNTVFICAAVSDYNDMDERETLMQEFRTIYRSFVTKIIKDKTESGVMLFDMNRIPYYEMPGQFGGGCVGIYFVLSVDNQIDLTYNAADWE